MGRVSLAFFVTAFVVVATPGTGALLSIAAGLRSGPRRSLVTAFGCTLGIIPHLVAAITGAAALLRAGGLAFEVVKALGVTYLLYMAWSMWRDTGVLAVQADVRPSSPTRTIVSAVLANLLNPKLTIFFFAFLPQFVSARATDPILQMVGLSAVFMVMTFVVFGFYGIFAGAARSHLIEQPATIRRLERIFSLTFVGLAGKLATTR
jgi:threonine/homoserine/homoserine lactone efflux protein